MTLNDTEKINFIKNNFHQYFDLTLNTDISTTETVNLVIPVSKLTAADTVTSRDFHHDIVLNESAEEIISKYEDTKYTGIKCICTEVIDGDTLNITIPYEDKDDEEEPIKYKDAKIRLACVNTPEFGYYDSNNNYVEDIKKGAEVSRDFLEQICYTKEYHKIIKKKRKKETLTEEEKSLANKKFIYIKIDKNREFDKYKRIRAVLIYNKKNINEILLKEGLAELEYIPPSISPFEWTDANTKIHYYNFENTNINVLYPYFNSEMTNIVFTPRDDPTKIYKHDIYKGVIYIKMKPFSQHIRMHLLPKSYDCTNDILIFKDKMITKENIVKTNNYLYNPDRGYINSYFLVDDDIRDRTNPSIENQVYKTSDWSDTNFSNTYCEFSYDISKYTKNFSNLQICAGYMYNNSTPYYSVHFTGIKDKTNIKIEDRCTLVDANYDKIENISNNVVQHLYDNNGKVFIPRNPRNIKNPNTYENIDHVTDIQTTHHKIIKYINDILYTQEDVEDTSMNKKRYTVVHWTEVPETN